MTQKERRRANSKSLSSEPTEPLRTLRDVLELGKRIVRELGLDPGVDTLARWMAHHVAELIMRAESAGSSEEGEEARATATAVILKLWEKRSAAPGDIDLLKRYKRAIDVLLVLSPEAEWWQRNQASDTRDRLAIRLYDDLINISLGNLLEEVVDTGPLSDTESQLLERFMEPEECELVHLLDAALKKISAAEEGATDTTPVPLRQRVQDQLIKRIDAAEKHLKELRTAIIADKSISENALTRESRSGKYNGNKKRTEEVVAVKRRTQKKGAPEAAAQKD